MLKSNPALRAALTALSVSPIFSHMRKTAYTSTHRKPFQSAEAAKEALAKAEEKRARKAARNAELLKKQRSI